MRVARQHQCEPRRAETESGIRIVGQHQQRPLPLICADVPRVITRAPAIAHAGHRHAPAIDDLIFDHAHTRALQCLFDSLQRLRIGQHSPEFVTIMIAEHGIHRFVDGLKRCEQRVQRQARRVKKIPRDQHAVSRFIVDAHGQPLDKTRFLVRAQMQIGYQHDARRRANCNSCLLARDPVGLHKTHPDKRQRQQ